MRFHSVLFLSPLCILEIYLWQYPLRIVVEEYYEATESKR